MMTKLVELRADGWNQSKGAAPHNPYAESSKQYENADAFSGPQPPHMQSVPNQWVLGEYFVFHFVNFVNFVNFFN